MPNTPTNILIGLTGLLALCAGVLKAAQAVNRYFAVDRRHGR